MNWVKEEYILSYGYYKKIGTKQSGAHYLKVLEIFRNLQGRKHANTRNTFALKIMNYQAFENENYKNSGGLENNKNFRKWILEEDLDVIWSEYDNLTKEIDKVIIKSNKIANYKNQTTNDNDIDISDETMYTKKHAQVTYKSIKIKEYLEDIKNHRYKVPLFQRDFVWSKQQMILFLNSLFKGYPFGNIIVWQPNQEDQDILSERNEIVKAFRHQKDKAINLNNNQGWILDGQQRTTSVISLMTEIAHIRKNKDIIFSFATNEFKSYEPRIDINYVEAGDIFNEEISARDIVRKYKLKENDKFDVATFITENLRNKMLKTEIGFTIVEKASLNTAINIFSEMNSTGKQLSLFDIIHAKWLSTEINYDLEDFINRWHKESNRLYKPDELTLTRTIYLLFSKDNIKSKEIMNYQVKKENIDAMDLIIPKSLNMAHDFLISEMKFKPELIPSINLIKFIAYAFYQNNNSKLNYEANLELKKYVKYVCLENYYSSATDQKVKENIDFVDKILKNDQKSDLTKNLVIDNKDLSRLKYNDGSSFYLYTLNILFRYAKSLTNSSGIPVHASDKPSSKINIHHIIPKSRKFEGQAIEDMEYGNSIANLVPLLEMENKAIKDKYPADYYKLYKTQNNSLDESLDKMLIDVNFLASINKDTKIRSIESFWSERTTRLVKLINNTI